MKIPILAPNSPKVPIAIPQKRIAPARSAQMWKLFETFGPVILLLVVVGVITAIKPSFILPANLLTVGLQGSVNAVLSIGMTLVIISGGIDLSVGTMMSLAMVVMAIFTNNLGAPMYVGIVVCVLVAVLGGFINGLLIAYANIPAFITTLGMLGIAQGLALKLSGGYSMYGFPDWYGFFGNGEIAHVPVPIWIVGVMLLVAFYIFNNRPLGRYTYGIGNNEESVLRAGVNVRFIKLKVYLFSGCMVGLAAVILSSRINSAHPGIGVGYELDAIAAAVIGGASLSGGHGTFFGGVIGALVMASIRFALNLVGIEPFLQQVFVGVVLIGAVYLDQVRLRQEEYWSKIRARQES
jgi:ribose/xylose/arabinose/galactoside ABC-type transport system permease subunit